MHQHSWFFHLPCLLFTCLLVSPLLFVFATRVEHQSGCDGTFFRFVEDPSLSKAIAVARARVLQVRGSMSHNPMSRLDSVLLLPSGTDKSVWRRGSFNPMDTAYPASTVKLSYMASSMAWCHEQGFSYDCLDAHVRPMIEVSDNFQTGVVVDIITGATNYNGTEGFDQWIQKRNYTARFLERHGLLANQIVLHKTFPTNSGQSPWGAELIARQKFGNNAMNPQCTASLMLELITGKLHGDALAYMKGLLRHERWLGYTSFGLGLPPASIVHAKGEGWKKGSQETAEGVYGSSYAVIQGSEAKGNVSAGWRVRFEEEGIYEVAIWSPQSSSFTQRALVTINHQHGSDSVVLSQQHFGGRWHYLGDYNFGPAQTASGDWAMPATVIVAPEGGTLASGQALAANAIKFSLWPSCRGVPGTTCPSV